LDLRLTHVRHAIATGNSRRIIGIGGEIWRDVYDSADDSAESVVCFICANTRLARVRATCWHFRDEK